MNTALKISDLHVRAPGSTLLHGVSLRIPSCRVTAVIGPSGAGKTTLLRCINRLATESDGLEVDGTIRLGDTAINLLDERLDGNVVRQRIGMIFQRPVVFPCSIADNVVFGARHLRQLDRRQEPELVERLLREVSLWDEVADRLQRPAEELSAGQQQRLAIARALAVDPEMLLMDEATSALDPRSARSLEGLIRRLADDRTIVLVSHDLAQARRVADWLALLSHGELIEQGPTEQLFSRPAEARTRDYLREPGGP